MSADNIDFQQSYARVFCGNQESSWHSTSVQAAEPLPSRSPSDTMHAIIHTMFQQGGFLVFLEGHGILLELMKHLRRLPTQHSSNSYSTPRSAVSDLQSRARGRVAPEDE